jgi:hypothetical protein
MQRAWPKLEFRLTFIRGRVDTMHSN